MHCVVAVWSHNAFAQGFILRVSGPLSILVQQTYFSVLTTAAKSGSTVGHVVVSLFGGVWFKHVDCMPLSSTLIKIFNFQCRWGSMGESRIYVLTQRPQTVRDIAQYLFKAVVQLFKQWASHFYSHTLSVSLFLSLSYLTSCSCEIFISGQSSDGAAVHLPPKPHWRLLFPR